MRERPDMGALRRGISYLGHYPKLAVLSYVALFAATGAQLMVPQLVQNIIDAFTNGATARQLTILPESVRTQALALMGWSAEQFASYLEGAESALLWAGGLIVAFSIMRGLFAFSQSYLAESVSQGIAFDFRNDLYNKIQALSFSYHDRTQTGQLMIRATDDVEKVRMFIGQGLLMTVQAVVLLVGSLVVLFATNARLTLVVLPILPLAFAMFTVFGRLSQPLFTEVQARLSRLNTTLQESLAGIRVVKAFVREPHQQAKFDRSAEDLMRQQLKISTIFSVLFPLTFLIANLGQAAVMYFGGEQIIGGTLTLGEWQKFSLYLMYVFFPMGMLGMIITQLAQASASANRIFEILDAESDVKDRPGAAPLPPVDGRIEFDNVSLRYFGGGEPVLREVSFTAEPGQTVALLGATGSGKSSIINLIPRFYDVTEGRILIDGHDVRDVSLD